MQIQTRQKTVQLVSSETKQSAVITCGGLMMAEKFVIPNMPRLEIVNVPPCNQSQITASSVWQNSKRKNAEIAETAKNTEPEQNYECTIYPHIHTSV